MPCRGVHTEATKFLRSLLHNTRHNFKTRSPNQPRTHRQEFLLKYILFSVRLAARLMHSMYFPTS